MSDKLAILIPVWLLASAVPIMVWFLSELAALHQ